jgi:hypothetical protein
VKLQRLEVLRQDTARDHGKSRRKAGEKHQPKNRIVHFHFLLIDGGSGKFSPTSQNLESVDHPLRQSTKFMDLEPNPLFF